MGPDGCPGSNHLLGNNEPFQEAALAAAVLLGPGHADKAGGTTSLAKLRRVACHA